MRTGDVLRAHRQEPMRRSVETSIEDEALSGSLGGRPRSASSVAAEVSTLRAKPFMCTHDALLARTSVGAHTDNEEEPARDRGRDRARSEEDREAGLHSLQKFFDSVRESIVHAHARGADHSRISKEHQRCRRPCSRSSASPGVHGGRPRSASSFAAEVLRPFPQSRSSVGAHTENEEEPARDRGRDRARSEEDREARLHSLRKFFDSVRESIVHAHARRADHSRISNEHQRCRRPCSRSRASPGVHGGRPRSASSFAAGVFDTLRNAVHTHA